MKVIYICGGYFLTLVLFCIIFIDVAIYKAEAYYREHPRLPERDKPEDTEDPVDRQP